MAKPRQSKEDKKLDELIASIYHRNCSGIQINIMDMSKVFVEGKRAAVSAQADGRDVPEAVTSAIVAFVQTIRTN